MRKPRTERAVADESEQADPQAETAQEGQQEPEGQQSQPARAQAQESHSEQTQQSAPAQAQTKAHQAINQTLQEQLTQALRPVVADLQQQIAQSVRQQMSQGLHVGGAKQAPQAAQASSQSQQANGQAQPAGQQAMAQPKSGLEIAIEKTVTAVKQAIDWIVRMAKQIYETVRALLDKAMAAISAWAVSMIVSGLKSAVKPLLRAAVSKGVSALGNTVESKGRQVMRVVG